MEVAFQKLQSQFRVMKELVASQRQELLRLNNSRSDGVPPERKNDAKKSEKKKKKKSREQRIEKNAWKVYPGIHGKGGRKVSRATQIVQNVRRWT